jgi:hypothetical protein
MSITITDVVARVIRFPTSRNLDGTDAMNPDRIIPQPMWCLRPTVPTAWNRSEG